MGRKKELTAEQYGAIIYGYKRGDSYQKIADNVQCGKTTVHDTIKRFNNTGSAIPNKRCGPKPLFDSKAQASLKKFITQNSKNRRLTAHKIQELWIKKKKRKVSIVTIRRTLRKVGLRSCVARAKPLISEDNKRKRLAWALERKDWTIAKWKKIVWSDESTFSQFSQGRSKRVWRVPEEEFDPSCLTATVKHSPSRMFWGCFSWHKMGPLVPLRESVKGQTYAKLLKKHAIPSLYKLVPHKQGIFQEDNALPHRSKIAADVRNASKIPVLPWPAQSPDLNPIKNL
jgi:transposase